MCPGDFQHGRFTIVRAGTTHDANFNITAAVQTDGRVAQRQLFDPYGGRSLLLPNWVWTNGGPWNNDTGMSLLTKKRGHY